MDGSGESVDVTWFLINGGWRKGVELRLMDGWMDGGWEGGGREMSYDSERFFFIGNTLAVHFALADTISIKSLSFPNPSLSK